MLRIGIRWFRIRCFCRRSSKSVNKFFCNTNVHAPTATVQETETEQSRYHST
ncbi:hypothetical protein HanPSC8_Chr08g0314981 [Helianthus annuus]|nr:hypothetical protein HanPSC8_Chr08g0314981 [Helianthus annuus]